MAGLDPAIHLEKILRRQMDHRVKPGDDAMLAASYSAACIATRGRFGAIQNAAGRSKRKFA